MRPVTKEASWSAAILIGGLSSRFGEPKFLSRVGGEALVRRVAKAALPTNGDLMLVTSQTVQPDVEEAVSAQMRDLAVRLRFVRDTPGPRTLAAGIEAALRSAESDCVFVAAADLPFLDRGLVLSLIEKAQGADAAVPFYRGFYEPVCAAYRSRMLPVLSRYRADPSGPLSTCFQDPSVVVERVIEREIRRFGDPDLLFLNVNTREDLQRARSVYVLGGAAPERGEKEI